MKSTVTQTIATEQTPRIVAKAAELSAAWGRVATFLAAHPEIAEQAGTTPEAYVLCYLRMADPARLMADAAQACVQAGGRVEEYRASEFGGVRLFFGPVYIQVYTDAHKVFTRRVTGMVERVEYTLVFDLPEQAETPAAVAR